MSKKVLSVVLAIMMIATLCVNAFAADDKALVFEGTGVKTGELHKGDKVTYTVNLKHESDDNLAALDASILYDAEVLKIALDEDEYELVTFQGTGSAIANYGVEGEIIFNAAEGTKGYRDFKKGANIIEVTFEVLKDASDAEIQFVAREFFTIDKVTITKGVTESVKVDCVVEPEKESDTDTTTDTTTDTATDNNVVAPPTGDTTSVVVMMVVLATAALAVVVARKRVA